ncbi:MAG TPA: L,D-transpeptidase/peptidoglycan binding protein [Solirubrobacterales bacterium]|nr:L,D-transpeptidase/peptidoglycan binding protein [Solirubrobacterales bacterium]
MKRKQSQSEHPGYGNLERHSGDEKRRRWPLVAVAVLLVFLIGGAFAAYAYDDARSDEIADGITVGGVDVGGLEQAKAERLLRSQLVQPLRKPVFVTYNGERWKLPAKQLKVRANVRQSVDEALETSREGGLPSRLVRYVTGGEVDENIRPKVAYFQPAVNRFVRRVAGAINQETQDATISATGSSLNVVAAENGRELRDNLLEKQLAGVVTSATKPRAIRAVVRTTRPEVTTDQVASAYPTYLTLDRANYTLRLWKNLKLAESYPVAVGQVGLETPAGLYHIQNKAVDPPWSVPNSAWAGSLAGTVVPGGVPENPLKARWLGIFDGAGIHGTDETYSLGTAASHGCVRMAIPDVIELYDQVPVGTPIYIG